MFLHYTFISDMIFLSTDLWQLWGMKRHFCETSNYIVWLRGDIVFLHYCLCSQTRNVAVNDIFSRGVTNEPIHISPWLQHRLPLHIITTRGSTLTTMDQNNNCNFWIVSFESNHNPIHLSIFPNPGTKPYCRPLSTFHLFFSKWSYKCIQTAK